jgi:hypothetical protein
LVRGCEKIGCHAERSEASAFIFLKTNDCRFFAALRMTGVVDFFTASKQGDKAGAVFWNPLWSVEGHISG